MRQINAISSSFVPACLILVAAAAVGCGGSDGGSGTSTGGRSGGSGGAASGGAGSGGSGTATGGGPGSGGAIGTGGSGGGTGGNTVGSGGGGGPASSGGSASGGQGGNGTASGGRGGSASGGAGGRGSGGGVGSGGMTSGGTTGSGGAGGGTLNAALSFDPPEGIYSVSLSVNTAGVTKTLTLHNSGPATVVITSLAISGTDAARFILEGTRTFPVPLSANGDLPLTIRFLPNAAGPTTVYTASLAAMATGGGGATASAGLYGLAMNTGNSEASLDQVVKTLGYGINVGGTSLTLGTGSAAIGEEVLARRFVRAAAGGMVGFEPVARYSPFEAAAYGYYTGTNPAVVRHPLGTMSRGPADNVANRTLFPPLDAGAMLTFDPGTASFGIFAESQANTASLGADARLYQEDGLNDDQAGVLPVHRVRVYPLKTRGGQAVANSFLVVCEEASNSDYQDYVFVLSNAAIAPN